LALWRGEAFADVPSDHLREQIAPIWEEQRLAALELRIDCDLRLGRHNAIAGELREVTVRYPFRERFWSQRMLALYRCGRRAEALECYRDLAVLLRDELGVDPNPEVRELHRAMLTGAPELDVIDPNAPDTANPPPDTAERTHTTPPDNHTDTPPWLVRNDLPGGAPDFTGRAAEIGSLLAAVPNDTAASVGAVGGTAVICAIDGMAGVGKTVLALRVAHQVATRYPDGQLFVDLRAHTPAQPPLDPAAALDGLLRAVGVAGARVPDTLHERAALWRAELTSRRVLIVLDNAATATQVRPLLPAASGCLVLVTSRRRLADLDTHHTFSLGLLPGSEARELFTALVGHDRVAAESSAADEVIKLCGQLPLAVRIAAARLRSRPGWTIAHLADRLRDGQRRLVELSIGDRSVAAAFELSYLQLAPDRQRLFRLLGLHPGCEIDVHLAAALTETDIDTADEQLEDLVDLHLLQQHAPGRYCFHDLLREHARATAYRTESETERQQAIDRVLDYYLTVTWLATRHFELYGHNDQPEVAQPPAQQPDLCTFAASVAWLDNERGDLITAIRYAAFHGRQWHAWRLANQLWRYFDQRGHVHDWISTHHVALEAARELDDIVGIAAIHRSLGSVRWHTGRYHTALDHYQQALACYRRIGDEWGQAATLNNMANAYVLLGCYQEAQDYFQQAMAIMEHNGQRKPLGVMMASLADLYEKQGRDEEAEPLYNRALDIHRANGDRQLEAYALVHLGDITARAGGYDKAMDLYEHALVLFTEVGGQNGVARTLRCMGTLHRSLGDFGTALDHHRRALAAVRGKDLGNTETEGIILVELGRTLAMCDQVDQGRGYLEQALVIALRIKNRYVEAKARDALGDVLLGVDDEAARGHWTQALAIAEELDMPETAALRDRLAHAETEQIAT
jgi:tetratricopeptide (TPR) repeat protein